MSTEYQFVNRERKESVAALEEALQGLEQYCRAALQEVQKKHPLIDDDVDGVIENVSRALKYAAPEAGEESHVIGTATSRGFSWRSDNGFTDKGSVRVFLEKNPGYFIENEYGVEIPIDKFLVEEK